MDELAARLRALLRRTEAGGGGEPLVAVGHYLVDLGRRSVTRAPGAADDVPEQVRLTKTEWAVLEILVGGPGRLVSGRELLQRVWGPDHLSDSGYLRFYMARLRRKLEPDPAHPRHLLTEPGMGYRFRP
jgi:two-component system KDP operon response regulator KdpE